MFYWLAYLCGGIIAFAVLSLFVLFWNAHRQFRQSPVYAWRERMLAFMHNAAVRADQERAILQREGIEDPYAEETILQQAFERMLSGISAQELEAFPGIGPVTISRLRDAGYTNLEKMRDGRVQVPGLGPKRLSDIRDAVRQLCAQAQSRFRACACPEAQAAIREIAAQSAAHSENAWLANARYHAIKEVMAKVEPDAIVARDFKLFHFLRYEMAHSEFQRVMSKPLPNVDEAIRKAEIKARQQYAERGKQPKVLTPAAEASERTPAARPVPTAATAIEAPPHAIPVPVAKPVDLFKKELHKTHAAEALPAPAPTAQLDREQPLEGALKHLELTIQFAFSVARVDGRTARKEKAVIEEFVRRRFGNDRALLNRAIALCSQYETAPLDPKNSLQQIAARFSPEERRSLLELGHAIANATGERNSREEDFLTQAAEQWNLAPTIEVAPVEIKKESEPAPAAPAPARTPDEQRTVLEIEPSVPLSADLIRRQYNLLTDRYAPEKFASLGGEFAAMAKGKREAVHTAATALIEPFGEPLVTASPAENQELRHNPDLDAMFGM